MQQEHSPRLPRRSLIAAAAVAGARAFIAPTAWAWPLPPSDVMTFTVLRDGKRLGDHSVRYRRVGDRLTVDIDILLEVKFGFLTFFRFSHHNTEIWQGDRLVSLETRTDDNGRHSWVSAVQTDEGLLVDGSHGRHLAPAETVPSSYWNRQRIERSELLETQRGHLMPIEVRPHGRETVMAAGRAVAAQRFKVTGHLDLDIWYSDVGQWVKLEFVTRGTHIGYELTGPGSDALAIADG